jgi:hypothetical protein
MNLCVPASRRSDTRKDLQERALTRTIQPDDTDNVTAIDLERHVLQCPDIIVPVLWGVLETPERSENCGGDRIPQCFVTVWRSDPVLLA